MSLAISSPFPVARTEAEIAASFRHAVVAIGNFDGVHRGHRRVIDAAIERARATGLKAAALTFEPHTRSFFRPQEPFFRLTDERAKLRLLAGTGLDGAIVLPFDASLATLPADAFVRRILVEMLAASGAAVGFDFHFGQARQGSPDFLVRQGEALGFTVDVVPPQRNGDQPVSSSAIRNALSEGRIAEANTLLGYPWFVSGEVIHGEKRGRELGFPTANLRLDPACGLAHGIYAVRVGLGPERYDAVASFGRRPTFDNGAPLLEVFLFDYAGSLYGKTLDVAFIGWVRPELRFSSVDALVERMQEDCRAAKAALTAAPDAFPPI